MAEVIPTMIGNQPVLILKEGTARTRGREAQRSNIAAAKVVAEVVKSSLGPKGMDKMLVDSVGDVTITNDGAAMLDEMEVQHPAAKMMVEVAKTTDKEVGDGTTSAVLLAGELVKRAEELLERGVHPTVIVDGYVKATDMVLQILDKIAIPVEPTDKSTLKRVAVTSMASKAVAREAEQLADMAVKAVLKVADKVGDQYRVDLANIKVEKKAGGSIVETRLIDGLAIEKEVLHPGMPRRVEDAKIALIVPPLEIQKPEFDAKVSIETPEQMRAVIDEEVKIFRQLVDKLAELGVNVALCQKGVDDMVQHFLAQRGIMAVRRVKFSDIERAARATGGRLINRVEDISTEDLGYGKLVEERKLGEYKWLFVEGCKNPKSLTILIRGGTEKVVAEAERSMHDALSVVKDVVEKPKLVAGGGAAEMRVASRLMHRAAKLSGREQLAVQAFAEALESIPATLAENFGLKPIDILAELRSRHEKAESWAGIDAAEGKVRDMKKRKVLEPLAVKEQVVKSASEAATLILRIDDVIAAGRMRETTPPKGPKEETGEETE